MFRSAALWLTAALPLTMFLPGARAAPGPPRPASGRTAPSPGATASRPPGTDAHWAFLAPLPSPPPAVTRRAWVRNPVDSFVLSRLEAIGLAPSPEADRSTLIRRLALDLAGLLPTPEETQAFVADARPDAYERLVDRLLASPHFGERWGRHWLDLARYADSDGYEKDTGRPYAWVFRDWVIRALNSGMPFDEFTVEQLAGDLLPGATPDQQLATGFHRNTLTNREGGVDAEEYRIRAVVDRVNTTGAVWLGLTVGCAECHSHKYDPLSQREYYQLFAFFNAAREAELPIPPQPDEVAAYERARQAWEVKKEGKAPAPPSPKAAVLAADPRPPASYVHIRGDFLRRGEAVRPGTPAVLPPLRSSGEAPTRLDLARWLMDPANPLTARVTVNRVWQQLFSRGLVATSNDFGIRGDRPTHPQLLDWLAVRFATGKPGPAPRPEAGGSRPPAANAWDLKALIRLIVTSATYRQSSRDRPELRARDPRNVWLARQSRLRPEAEIVRDLYLCAGGLMNPAVGGPSIRPPLPADIAALGYANSVRWPESTGADRYRRGMYIFFQRTVPYPMLMTFDAPDSNTTCTRRERSNTPLQALAQLNDPVFFECAQALGRRLVTQGGPAPADRIRLAFRVCLSRDPLPVEAARLEALYRSLVDGGGPDETAARLLAGAAPPAGTPPVEAAAWVLVARTVMNLDEFVTRE